MNKKNSLRGRCIKSVQSFAGVLLLKNERKQDTAKRPYDTSTCSIGC